MAVTSIRLQGSTKEELDRLQGLVQAETGERLTHDALVRRLVALAHRHEPDFLEPADAAWRPPSPQEYRRLRGLVRDWGAETDARRVDEDLYGGAAR